MINLNESSVHVAQGGVLRTRLSAPCTCAWSVVSANLHGSSMELPWKFHGRRNGSFVEVCKKGAFLFTPTVCVHTCLI